MNPKPDFPGRFALALATGFGLGYLPIAPGTWGSLGSLGLYAALEWSARQPVFFGARDVWMPGSLAFLGVHIAVTLVVAVAGVWAAEQAVRHFRNSDPRPVVIDEISGQQIVFLGLAPVGWKYLLLGFLLFRAFDIWKPFPVRRSESWPGGWGIMADDWFAGLYAALGLWVARLFGL